MHMATNTIEAGKSSESLCARDDDAVALRDCLSRAAESWFGSGGAAIASMHRRRSEFSSSYETEVIDVTMLDGRQARLFLKNYGVFRNGKEEMSLRREREMRVFRELLAGGHDLGTPRYCASTWDEARGRLWLVLEFVEAAQLRHVDFPHWVAAMAWLGRMQAHFATRCDEVARQPLLIRQDSAFFHGTADLAINVVLRVSVPLAARLCEVLRRYGPLIRIMADQPLALVHGAYRPPNVLIVVDECGVTRRVCPIDWEEASLGSPLYDVAYLCDGFESPRLDQMWDAYLGEAGQHAAARDRREIRRVVNCFRAHKLLNLLGKSVYRNYPLSKVEKMIGMADELIGSLE
jgi:aminoglycoside phosphotransferase (APT) family kinase protein